MPPISERFLRDAIVAITAPLPRGARARARAHLRGRVEVARFRGADFAVLSRAKSGRTWLRAMLSRLYQLKYALADNLLLDYDNFRALDRRAPRVCFTHGHALGHRLDRTRDGAPLLAKPVVFLVRHPCDVAVSEYFQSTKRAKDYKRELYGVDDTLSMHDFVMRSTVGLPAIVAFQNEWARRLPRMTRALVVRYEDMRARPVEQLARVVAHIGAPFTDTQVRDAVAYGDFERLKEKERTNHFGSNRLVPGDVADPDSYKVRRAKVGGYRDYFDAAQLHAMHAYLQAHLTPAFGYLEPAAPTPEPAQGASAAFPESRGA